MGYVIEKGHLYQKGGRGLFGYKPDAPEVIVTTLKEAKEKFEELAGTLPPWLKSLEDPTVYLGVEEEIEEDGQHKGLIVSIEGAENTKLKGE